MTDTLMQRLDLQARLLGEMMERLGVDPALTGGAPLAAAARACRACPEGAACRRFLDAPPGPGTAPPAFCPNGGLFARLRGSA